MVREAITKGVAVVGAVGEQDLTLSQVAQHVLRASAVMGLAFGQLERDRQPLAFGARLAELHHNATSDGADFSVMLIDLDYFKQVNDSFGHAAGDQLLVEVARRLESTCRQSDLVARLGGDEFALLAISGQAEDGMRILAERVLDAVTRPLNVGSVTILPSCSIGVTTFSNDPSEHNSLLLHADEALYAAKAKGRRTWAIYKPYSLKDAATG